MEEKRLLSSDEFEAVSTSQTKSEVANNEGVKDNFVPRRPITNENKATYAPRAKAEGLKVSFLGGVNEIGKNMTVLEYGDDIIVIDAGLMFPSDDMLGIDLVIPDISYLLDNASKIRGIVITHAHEDHIGALPYVFRDLKVPVYGSKLTVGFIGKKMDEHKKVSYKANTVKSGQKLRLGVFEVEFIHTNHSIPGAFALGIKTPVGNVVHTGDFKIDYTPTKGEPIDLVKLAEYGSKGVLMLFADSTNANRPGFSMSEMTVSRTMESMFQENATKRIIVATFASNLYRLEEMMKLAEKHKRKVLFTGRSMIANVDIASKLGEITINKANLIEVEQIKNISDSEVCVFCTGSQGEPMSALSRMSNGEFKGLSVTNNDVIIFSSSPIPGNERAVYDVINDLMMKGAKVIYNKLEDVHASGHAYQDELKTLMAIIKPTYFVPVHGEQSHLQAHKHLATSMGVAERNIVVPQLGMKIEVSPNSIRRLADVRTGTRLIDGAGMGELDSNVLRERKQLSEDGLCVVIINVNTNLGILANRPEIISRGFAYQGESEVWLNEAKDTIMNSCENVDLKNRDYPTLKLAIKKGLTNFLFKRMKRRPLIIPIIVED